MNPRVHVVSCIQYFHKIENKGNVGVFRGSYENGGEEDVNGMRSSSNVRDSKNINRGSQKYNVQFNRTSSKYN